ncbi:hypothetical protein ASPWEDRAFT_175997 [Aspergillus wentii DTO 134E9]|uniref:AAA+ ATPase domain-containing protein n=1 Tax=Aspergillus wentii DTO 134E9 TaxID=1073089 RepID=A0A1L9R7L5_ASPWE|nr:uncharacterized protein ASPWEDRAFT_175997 [Aspergillus wentii DTO 134E9]KAI9927516.1 hypothetical protein MW887_003134 [Aspergillus wentii]OJJ30894.1 hypothetical protein ASPWEDRAFT_175997 [Aspergillus wentii DTO 134E9]
MADTSNEPQVEWTYNIPNWFLEENIKTPTELGESKIAIVKTQSPTLESQQDPEKYELHEDLYGEFRDMVAGTLLNRIEGSPATVGLDPHHPCLTLQARSLVYGTAVLTHLAKDLNTTLVHLDFRDLQSLACDFFIQDTTSGAQEIVPEESASNGTPSSDDSGDSPGCLTPLSSNSEDLGIHALYEQAEAESQDIKPAQPEDDEETINLLNRLKTEPSAVAIMDVFFAPRCEKHTRTKGLFRRAKQSIQSIVEASWKHSQTVCSPSTINRSPVILHIRDPQDIRDLHFGTKILKNIRNVIQEYRRKQIPVVVIATVLKTPTGSMARKLLTSTSTVQFDLDTSLLSKYEALFEEEKSRYDIRQTNRTFKQYIRLDRNYHLWSHLVPDDLDLITHDDCPDISRTANQISGLLMTKGTLQVQDFRDILARNDRLKQNNPSPEPPKEEKQAKTISDRLEEIRDLCDEYEQGLFPKVIDTEKQKVTYDNVIVQDSVKDTMQYLVRLSNVKFEGSSQALIDSVNVKGALLYGPPGTGKTQLVRAMASDSNSAMIVITASDIESKWVGQTEKNISAAFSLARKLSPCILFIDEVDALLYRRSSCDQSWRRESLTQFLQEMDGLSNNKDAPFVIGAANHPMDLDEAFLRRLPYKVKFGMPGLEERRKILSIFLKQDDLDPLFTIDALAQQTEGYTGSDLRALCGQAVLDFAIEKSKSQAANEDGTEAVIKVQLGVDHFARVLQRVQPSVSARSHLEIDKFNSLFNS